MIPHTAAVLVEGAGACAAAGRLWWLGLTKRFPALFVYLVFLAAKDLAVSPLGSSSTAYFYSYVVLEPVGTVLGIIAVLELFALIFEKYPGIQTVGRWITYAGTALAVCISLAITLLGGGPKGRSKLFYFEVSERWVVFTLAFIICSILVCLSRYPLRLRSNSVIGSVFFSALFLSRACQLLIDSVTPTYYNQLIDWTESVVAGICLTLWAVLLKREYETVPVQIKSTTPQEEHLLQQLQSLNQVMARAARR